MPEFRAFARPAPHLPPEARLKGTVMSFDHRHWGAALDLFVFDEQVGRGLPLWLPAGAAIRDELEKFISELEFKAGYQRVHSPHLAREELYHRSGHLPFYEEGMYPMLDCERQDGREAERYRLRPMNCPHHHRIFDARPRSYRNLPLRLAEYGQVYRYELSGSLRGMIRARGFCQNDAHIYCREDQLREELRAVLRMYRQAYSVLGLSDYRLRLSLKGEDEKFIGDADVWRRSQVGLREALEREGLSWFESAGEAAFYGPKIDVQMEVEGREETVSTIQVDGISGHRMGLRYVGPDGREHIPWIIHRAPLGTHERLLVVLLERYLGSEGAGGGMLPLWLSPEQVRVIPVSARFESDAEALVAELRNHGVRARVDASSAPVSARVRDAWAKRVPVRVVYGANERAGNSIDRIPREAWMASLLERIRSRADHSADGAITS